MEKTCWIGRRIASLKLARNATGSESRLIHYDLAGRYGLNASSAETQAIDLANSVPPAIRDRGFNPSFGGTDDA